MFRDRVAHRLTGLFVRWNLIGHPYGREYAMEQYSITGRRRSRLEPSSRRRVQFRAAALAATMVLLSLLAAGVLFASA
jgi:hypothetical protein